MIESWGRRFNGWSGGYEAFVRWLKVIESESRN
jgi:hypothetical protein